MEYKFCTYCKTRHPISDFSPGQSQCKWARVQLQSKRYDAKTQKNLPADYKKFCKFCGELRPKEDFHTDRSQKDGLSIYCRKHMALYRGAGPKALQQKEYLSGVLGVFREKLLKAILTKVTDEDRSITRQIVEDFRHEGQPVSFAGREWQIDILNNTQPNVIGRKPSQTGFTWLLERFVFALLMRYNDKAYRYTDHMGTERTRFIEAIYSFETLSKAQSWSKVRLEKIKADNIHVRDALKMGKSESTMLMQFGRTSLHLVGRATVSGVLTISADIVIIDEKDRDQNPEISNQIGSRLLESSFMNTPSTKGIIRTTSTPEVSGAGISLQYEKSTQHEWEILCVHCGTWQVLTYPDCIGNFYEKGEDPVKDEAGNDLVPFWRCQNPNCHQPIDWSTIGKWDSKDPDHYVNCRWKPRHPERYNEKTGLGTIGYQVPFATAQRPASFFIANRDNPDHSIQYLYNHLLGLPYDDVTKTLVKDNFAQTQIFGWGYSGPGKYVLGCDHHPAQGGFIVIWKQIPNTQKAALPEGKWVMVYLEHVKNNHNLFDQMEDNGLVKKGRIWELITEFNMDIAMLDIQPDTNEVEKLIREFGTSKTVWGNKSGAAINDTFRIKEEDMVDNEIVPTCRVFEDKVAAIDFYFNMIRFKNVQFIADSEVKSPKLMRDFVSAHTNLYKGEVSQIGRSGMVARETLAAINITEIYKKRQARVNDHWAMASKFCAQATRVAVMANRTVRGVVAPAIHSMNRIPGT